MTLKNVFGQFHNFVTTIGLFIFLEVCQYALDNATWTWRGLIISIAGAALKWAATHDDHVKTEKAVKKAVEQTVITTQEVLEKKGEIQ